MKYRNFKTPVSLVMYNDNIIVTPAVDDYNYSNSTPGNNPHNCEQ